MADVRTPLSDPLEERIALALDRAGIQYRTGEGGHVSCALDFELPTLGVYIEVKRFHTDRIAAQMARVDNVIAVQGERAVHIFAQMIEDWAKL